MPQRSDIIWPTEIRGGSREAIWHNKMLRACKKAVINDVKVVNGSGKIQDGNLIITMPNAAAADTAQVLPPFTIYNTTAATIIIEATGAGYNAGDILTVDGGTGTPMKIIVDSGGVNGSGNIYAASVYQVGVYTVQPTFPNSPTGGSGTGFSFSLGTASDNWKAFQIRDGFCGARSKYFLDQIDSDGNPNAASVYFQTAQSNLPTLILDLYDYANGESIFPIVSDGQGIGAAEPNQQPEANVSAFKMPANQDVLIAGIDPSGDYFSFRQIVMCDFPDDSDSLADLSFWLEIVDDADTGFGVNLWARMCGGDSGTTPTMSGSPWPASPNVIPIGYVRSFYTLDGDGVVVPDNVFAYHQKLSGNLIGRFPSFGGSDSIAKFTCDRGAWDADTLENQVFYPGDIVLDDTVAITNALTLSGGIVGTVSSYGLYICKGDDPSSIPNGNPFFGDTVPSADLTRWKLFASKNVDA